MDTRLKFTEVKNFIKNTRESNVLTKQEKRNCWKGIFKNILMSLWNKITAPFIYPIWYLFRKKITNKIYKGTSWREINDLMSFNKTKKVKQKLKNNGIFLYWIWTYGDAKNPLQRGGLPKEFGKNTFWNRFKYSALRNPRFNYNYIYFRTGEIIKAFVVIDNRNFNYMHKSPGIGDSPNGIYFCWLKDHNSKWYFIYEDNNVNNIFYFGYTGFLKQNIGNSGGRFEIVYRKTSVSYKI